MVVDDKNYLLMTEAIMQVRDDFSRWASEFRSDVVVFGEDRHPVNEEEWPDFRIQWRGWCEPTSLSFASVYLVAGEDIRDGDCVGVFIERRERLAARLGVRFAGLCTRGSIPEEAYGGGFYVSKMGERTLFLLLNLVVNGQISIRARAWPMVGLGRTVAVATSEVRSQLTAIEGYDSSWWLYPAEEATFLSRVIQFEPWPRKNKS